MRILFVEDEPSIAEAVASLLKNNIIPLIWPLTAKPD